MAIPYLCLRLREVERTGENGNASVGCLLHFAFCAATEHHAVHHARVGDTSTKDLADTDVVHVEVEAVLRHRLD